MDFALYLVAVSLLPLALGSFPFSSTLATDPATGQALYQLYWTFDSTQKTITFNVVVRTTGWVGFGLSPNGGVVGSDVVIGWIASDGSSHFHDRYASANAVPPIDPSQDWFLLSGSETNGYTNLTFTRKWVTCDSNDRDVKKSFNLAWWRDGHNLSTQPKANTAKVVFSWGAADPADISLTGQYHGANNRGSVSLNLLGGLVDVPPQSSDAQNFTVAVNQVPIPAVTTTYWCTGFKLSSAVIAQKRYITRISPQISPNSIMHVHHILVYQCLSLNETTDIGRGYDCDQATDTIDGCRLGRPVIAAWAVGGNDFIYPSGIAYPIGGSVTEQYVVMEMHYNNPSLVSGVTDSSGLTFTYTSTPPTYEAGILTTGYFVTPPMIIPPRDPSFTVYGTCSSTCTANTIPPTGINIFGNLLHTHVVGRGVTLRHLRPTSTCGGLQELPPIDQNLQYDFNFQQTNILTNQVNVLPGDILQVACRYNTSGVNNVTLGGESTDDEMCLSFPVYYPRIELSSCLSYSNPQSYINFASSNLAPSQFQALLALFSPPNPNPDSSLKAIFGTLAWSQKQQDDFQSIVTNATFYGGCDTRNGGYFGGVGTAINVKCPYTDQNTCGNSSMNIPVLGSFLLTIIAIFVRMY